MAQEIYDPLDAYVNVFSDRFRHVAEATFAQLAAESQVDVEANRSTCQEIYTTEKAVDDTQGRITQWGALCIVLWIAVAVGVVLIFSQHDKWSIETIAATGASILCALLALFLQVHPKLKKLRTERNEQQSHIDELKTKAWQQMNPLNSLYDWDVLTRMMTATVPNLQFDPYFTTQRLADLEHVYGWDGTFNSDRSVICSHSGLINGNPFVICRTRKMIMGSKTYYGSKTIYWQTRERDANGRMYTVRHSQTLTASYTAPYPEYYEKTRLIYGNTAAPDLTFYRQKSGLANKEGTLAFKWKRRKLRKKARDLSNADFAMMTNEDFETIFDTSNRNNNQQYALLFTPLAQENMTRLLQDETSSYGDDFDFDKEKMINIILSDHMQDLNLDMNPEQYCNFDYDKAEKDFYDINARYFRAIYFALAPLLCIPLYQQMRSRDDIYGRDMPRHSSYWEHEALANYWGEDHFKAPDCVTHCILKTSEIKKNGNESTLTVSAHGYKAVQRLSYFPVLGGDGRYHQVPVYWDEYIPVTGTGQIQIVEDNTDMTDAGITQQQRIDHINELLSRANLKVYRRHIASSL